ncbi:MULTISPECIES: hypothetical protein [unclassified Mesorhizobium]|nr:MULTISPECIES: hypothetical protein [unclassified Mesorhizobium]
MGEILTLDGDPAEFAESGIISAVYETTFKPGVKPATVFNRSFVCP